MTAAEQIRRELEAWERCAEAEHGPSFTTCKVCHDAVDLASMNANWPTYLAALLDVAEAAQRFIDAADLRLGQGDAYFDSYHDARHDLYQALAVIPQDHSE